MRKFANVLLAIMSAVAVLGATLYKAQGIFDYERSTKEIVTAEESVTAGNVYDRDGIIIAEGGKDGKMQVVGNDDFVRSFSNIFGISYGFMKSPFYIRAAVAEELYGLTPNKVDKELFLSVKDRGNDVQLTIQRILNEKTYAAIKEASETEDVFAASAVVYNYKNGEILAAVNTPSFDLNDQATYPMGENGLLSGTEKGGCGSNKMVMEYYAPDSAFKPILDAIVYDYDPSFLGEIYCSGEVVLDGETVITDHGHGQVDLKSAIAQSCNIYQECCVYPVPTEVLVQGLKRFGLNRKGAAQMASGMTFYTGEVDFDSTFNKAAGILGEGETKVTPLQLARMYGALLNKGVMLTPKIVKGEATKSPAAAVSEDAANTLKNALVASVERDDGTCRKLRFDDVETWGKTGTSSSGNSCWCVAGTLDERFPFVVVVGIFGVHGATGADTAQPIVRNILETSFEVFG